MSGGGNYELHNACVAHLMETMQRRLGANVVSWKQHSGQFVTLPDVNRIIADLQAGNPVPNFARVNVGITGWADIGYALATGALGQIEVKTHAAKQSQEQKLWEARCRALRVGYHLAVFPEDNTVDEVTLEIVEKIAAGVAVDGWTRIYRKFRTENRRGPGDFDGRGESSG